VLEVPSEIDYQINLEATRTEIGLMALSQGRLAEGREQLTKCAAQWEALKSFQLAASKRAIVDQNRGLVRNMLASPVLRQLDPGQSSQVLGAIGIKEWQVRGAALQKAGDDAEAEAVYRRALEACLASADKTSATTTPSAVRDKEEAASRNSLAWLFALAPGRKPEQIREAVTLSERAVELDPENGNIWNTLALARYRAGDWSGASSAIERSMRQRNGGDANDWVILALIRWRQGDQLAARSFYDKVTTEFERQQRVLSALRQRGNTVVIKTSKSDLQRLHEEAAALLGMPPPNP
jgi:tetratricopeptide (TPR) repeat protein